MMLVVMQGLRDGLCCSTHIEQSVLHWSNSGQALKVPLLTKNQILNIFILEHKSPTFFLQYNHYRSYFVIILISSHIMVCWLDLQINQELYLFHKASQYKVIQHSRSQIHLQRIYLILANVHTSFSLSPLPKIQSLQY